MQLPREVIVGKGTLTRVPEVMQRLNLTGSALIIAGTKSYEIAGKTVQTLLEPTGMTVDTLLVETASAKDISTIEKQIKTQVDEAKPTQTFYPDAPMMYG